MMANPQPTPFVQFSKELFDALLLSTMPATHKEIVLAVIRRTYGDHGRKTAPISQSLLQRMTGRSRNGVRNSFKELLSEGVIIRPAAPSFSSSAIVGLNKDYERWGKWSVDRAAVVVLGQDEGEGHPDGGGEGHPDGGGEGHPDGGGEGHPDGPIEDLETKEKKDMVKSPPKTNAEFDRFWELYPRKVAKAAALKVWTRVTKKTDPDIIIEGLRSQLKLFSTREAEFIPHADRWLKYERWKDNVPKEKTPCELVDEEWGIGDD